MPPTDVKLRSPLALATCLFGVLSLAVVPSAQAAVVNDDWQNAIEVQADAASVNLVDTNAFSSLQAGESRPCGYIGSTVWYKITTTLEGNWLQVATWTSGFDTVVAVYEDDPTSEPIVCNDDSFHAAPNSLVQFDADPGKTYYVQIGGKWGAHGEFGVTFSSHHTAVAPKRSAVDENGNCTWYNDQNNDSNVEEHEVIATTPCPI